ncbi:Ig domain-containing protein [Vibrio parahaemolyticus]|nr:Ig domain-containing protein [Vibrio parahaemolyticus]
MIDKAWLKSLLTPAKQKKVMWAELIDTLTDAINEYVSPYLDRLKSRGSLFEQSQEDLEIELRELGDDFAYGDLTEENLPIIIMQREDEFHFKNTVYPLKSTLAREFTGIDVTWEPLYAPKGGVYGEGLVIKGKFGDLTGYQREDYFLTSRGLIRVPLNSARSYVGGDEDALAEFENHLRRVAYPLIPLDIVLEGQMYFIQFTLNELSEIIDLVEISVNQQCIFSELEEDLSLSVSIDSSYEMSEGLREPAYAEMRDGPIGLDHLCLDYEEVLICLDYLSRTVVSIAINESIESLNVGDIGSLSATVTYDNGSQESSIDNFYIVEFSSSDDSIITIDANGNYSAVASGSVTITATSNKDTNISDSIALESIEDYERFSIVVGEGLYGPDTLTSVGVFLYSPDHSDYKDTFGDFSSKNWPSGEPIISITSKAQLMWRRRASDVVAYFSAHAKWPKWRDWDGITITLTHESESISQSLTLGNYYIKISDEGIPVHDFLTARIGQTVDVELTEYVPTRKEKAAVQKYELEQLREKINKSK